MAEEYVFPEDNWYLKITNDNFKLVNKYRKSKSKAPISKITDYEAIDYDSWGVFMDNKDRLSQIEITTDQFKEHVLGIKPEPVIEEPQDYTYLIEFLNNKQIK